MTAISHPDAKFQGRNLIDLQDADGKYVLREIRDVALNQGQGFVDYRWVRLNEEKSSPKIGYVFHYEPWDWIIGTGVYVDDIDAEAQKQLAAEQARLSITFDEVRFNQDGFFFILDQEGGVVVAPNGRDLSPLASTPSGQQYVTDIIAAAPATDGPITNLDSEVALQGDQSEVWSTTISTFTPLGWILVSAIPGAVLEAPGRTLAWQQAGLSLIVLIIGLVSGLLLSRRIIRPVEAVTRAARDLSEDNFDPASLDTAAQRSDEVGELARTFQRMGTEIVARERRLREQVAKLSVQIDRTKVEEAVSDIAESEYFLRIKERAEELRWNRREDPPSIST
jgi:HAMP domain-containing protein